MVDNFVFKGQWFLPSTPEKRLYGILTYDTNDGCSLELFGSFDESPLMPIVKNEDIILGITNDSKEITLYKCFVTKAVGATLVQGRESGIPPTFYSINFILEGAWINSSAEISFKKIVSEIHNLDEWVGVSGFKPIALSDYNDIVKNGINVHYKIPEPIRFTIREGVNACFSFAVNHSGWSRYQKSLTLKQKVELIIETENELSLNDFLHGLFSLQNFLILALYNRTYPTRITLYDDKFIKDYGDGKPIRKKINLYFTISNRSKIEKPKLDLEMLFCYGYIREEFPTIIKNWYEKYEMLEPAFNLLFEQFYNNERFSENTFLNLAQAAENFHARTNNHTRMAKEDYEIMKASIYAATPNEYHEWLQDQFNFGNNLNLHTRLTEIVTKYSNEVLDKIIGDKELFIKQVKWSRNYYTHYSSSGEKQALKGTDLFYLSEKLKIVLVCAFLLEVGFDKEKLKYQLEQNKYRFFNHLVKW